MHSASLGPTLFRQMAAYAVLPLSIFVCAQAGVQRHSASATASLVGEPAAHSLRSGGQFADLGQALKEARFAIRPARTGSGATARNAVHGFDTQFRSEGVTLAGGGAAPWQLDMSLSGVGRGRELEPVGAGALSSHENRVEYERRTGSGLPITEWYVNDERGLEQGFTFPQRPLGSVDEPLSLRLTVETPLQPTVTTDGKAVVFTGSDNTRVRCDGLKAWDARGRDLPCRLAMAGKALHLEVGDAGAQYPVIVDPTYYLESKLTTSAGAAGDHAGWSVALSGDTAVVGAYLDDVGANVDQGSAYVFIRSGGVWTEQAFLTADDGAQDDQFGHSVGVWGDTALIGSHGDDGIGGANQGAGYVFTRSGGTWSQQAKLTASDGAAGDLLGYSVALWGDTALLGAVQDDVNATVNQGSAYVFVRSGVVWTQQARLTASDGAANPGLGRSVALWGNTAVACTRRDGGLGGAYVYTRSGATWSQQAKLMASDGAVNDFFGWSVGIEGDTIVVGAAKDDVGGNVDQGSAYVFTRSGAIWTQQAKLVAADGVFQGTFGYSVDVSGDGVLVGSGPGTAYLFTRSAGLWTQHQKLAASDGEVGDSFGSWVAMEGSKLLVGAARDDESAGLNVGSAYVFSTDIVRPQVTLVGTVAGPPTQLLISALDSHSGIAAIVPTIAENCEVSFRFTPGTREPVLITATKINQSKKARVAVKVTDVAGNFLVGDPVIANLEISRGKRRVVRTYRKLPAIEHYVSVQNGAPGLTRITLFVNGRVALRTQLLDGETRNLDVRALLGSRSSWTARVVVEGSPGAQGLLVISDSPASGPITPAASEQRRKVNRDWNG